MTSLLLAAVALALSPQQAAPAPAASRFAFHVSPALDLYSAARAAAASKEGAPAVDSALLEAVRALEAELAGPAVFSTLAWGPLDGLLGRCATAQEVRAAFEGAKESLVLPGSKKEVELRRHALAIGDALVAAEPAFLADGWKPREQSIAAARARWDESVAPKERALLEYHLRSLGITDRGTELRVCLVDEAPWPGAYTVRDDAGGGLSFVAVGSAEGSQLFEIVLHEVTHTFDVVSELDSVFAILRSRLIEAGFRFADRPVHDLPHALMFVQSAESIRRIVDPAHVDYGEREGLYSRLPGAENVRALWREHLDGKLTRDEALAEIVASSTPPKKK